MAKREAGAIIGALKNRLATALLPHTLVLVLQASLVIFASGCSKPPAEVAPITPVMVMTVGAVKTAAFRTLPGIVTPRYAANVGFQVAGRIQARMVDVGSRVRQGQPLVSLNAADYAQGVLVAQDQIAAAHAEMEQSVADAKRFKSLADRGLISQAEMGSQQARADAAQARLDQASRQLELARNRMAYTTLVAPFDSIVTALSAEVGQVLAEGMPVVSVARDDTLEVSVELPEDMRVSDVSSDSAFDGHLTGKSSIPLKLKLREVAPATTAPLRTFRATFTILNADSIQSELRIGRSAEVTLSQPLSNRGGVELPATALISNGQDVGVWCVDFDGNTLRRQVVTVKAVTNDGVLVDGLEAGQRVVIAGTDKLNDAQPVRPIERTGTGHEITHP
jgi:multidrug efflux system membrane fusion protein